MADPTKYTPGYDFSDYQAQAPASPLPGTRVDIELQNISQSVDTLVDAVKDVRRSDGKLANQSVGPDQLSSALSIGFTNRGTWAEGVSYSSGDGAFYGQALYSSRLAHTATMLTRPDLDPGVWNFLFSIADFVIPDNSIGGAKMMGGAIGARELAGSIWLKARGYDTVAELLANDGTGPQGLGYAGSGALVIVGAGDIITAQGFCYEVAASDATDDQVETAGGVKLRVLPDQNGRINVLPAGAVGDAIAVGDNDAPDGVITSGDQTFTSAQAAFTSGDVGKSIMVAGAGASGVNLITTIASVTNGTSVELANAATMTVSSAKYVYGTDDTEAFRSAFAVSQSIYIPDGKFLITGALTDTTALKETVTWEILGAGLWGITEGQLRGTWVYYCVDDAEEPFLTFDKTGAENTNSKIGGFWFTGLAGRQGRFLIAERSFARDKIKDLEVSYLKGLAKFKHDSYSKRWRDVKTLAVDYGIEWPVPDPSLGLGEGSTQDNIFEGCRFRATQYGVNCLIPIQTTQFNECIWDTKDTTNSDGYNSIRFDKVVNLVFNGGYNESRDCGTFDLRSDPDKGYAGFVIMKGMTQRNRYTTSRNSTGLRLRGRIEAYLTGNYWNGWAVPIEVVDGSNAYVEYADSFANCDAPGVAPNDYVKLTTSTNTYLTRTSNGRRDFGRAPQIQGVEMLRTGDSSGQARATKFWDGTAEEFGNVEIASVSISSTSDVAAGWFRSPTQTVTFRTAFASAPYYADVSVQWATGRKATVFACITAKTATSMTYFLLSPESLTGVPVTVNYVAKGQKP